VGLNQIIGSMSISKEIHLAFESPILECKPCDSWLSSFNPWCYMYSYWTYNMR